MGDRRRVWRWIGGLGALALVGLAVRSLAVNWTELRSQRIEWDLSVPWLLASLLLVLGTYAVLIEAWRRILLSLGERLSPGTAARIWLVSTLGRYVPGKVWAVSAAAYLARSSGLSASRAVAATILLQAYAVITGTVAAVGSGEQAAPLLPAGVAAAGPLLGVALLAGGLVLARLAGASRLRRFLPEEVRDVLPLPVLPQVLALGANLLAWGGYGAAFACLGRGLSPGIEIPLGLAVSAFAAAYVVGFLALFSPGGIGPRESVLVLLLTGTHGPLVAATMAVASRVMMTVAEILGAVPALIVFRQRSRAERPPGSPPR